MEEWGHEGKEAVGRPPTELEELGTPMDQETAGCMRDVPSIMAQGKR